MVFLERPGAATEGMGEWPEDAGMVGGRLARDSCVWSREENERSHRAKTRTWVETVRVTRDSR